jgi:hypothetical protein
LAPTTTPFTCRPLAPPRASLLPGSPTVWRRHLATEAAQGQEAEARLEKVANQITYDLNHVLTTKIDFTDCCYHDNILLEDNIRGKKFGGLLEYMKNCNVLKIVTHVKFAYSRMHVDTVTINPVTAVIRVEWRVTGIGMARLLLRYFPDR